LTESPSSSFSKATSAFPFQRRHEAENKVLNLAYFSTAKTHHKLTTFSPAIHHKITTIYHPKNTLYPTTPLKKCLQNHTNPPDSAAKKNPPINPKKNAADRHKERPPCRRNESL
jgi:hypothetical protein